MTNIVICIYYAVIIGWAASYTYYSVNAAWGADPQGFFFKDFLQMAGPEALGLDFVGKVVGPLAGVWVFTAAIMALGVQKGVARLVVLYAAAFGDVFDYGRHFADVAGRGKGLGRIVYARLVETRRFQGLGGGIRADFLFAFHLLRHYGYLFFLFEEKNRLGRNGAGGRFCQQQL